MLKTLHEPEEQKKNRQTEIKEEAKGSSQIGPFDFCPRLGFREPGIQASRPRRSGGNGRSA